MLVPHPPLQTFLETLDAHLRESGPDTVIQALGQHVQAFPQNPLTPEQRALLLKVLEAIGRLRRQYGRRETLQVVEMMTREKLCRKEKYTVEQIAVVLMQAALSFEYYMQEEFNLYDVGRDSPSPQPPAWMNHSDRLSESCQDRVYELGLGVWEQETFGDQLICEDFHPLADQVARAAGPAGGKVAFLALAMALVLETFIELVSGTGKEIADELHGEILAYLAKTWGVDLAQGTVNPALRAVHLPQAHEAARRWRRRVDLLSQTQ